RRAGRDRGVAALPGPRGGRLRRELRAVRPVRRPARGVGGAARAGGAHPGGRPAAVAAGDDRHRGGDGGVPRGADAGAGAGRRTTGGRMSRIGRVERVTGETSVLVEVNLDGTGRYEVSTGVGFFDHML